MRRLLFVVPTLLLLVLLWVFAMPLLRGDDPNRIASALIGKPAPTFALSGLEGKPGLNSDQLAGQVTVLNFFASWCAPCRAEHATLMRLAASNKAVVVGIAYKDEPANTAKFLRELGMPFKSIGMDRAGRAGIDFGISGVPETFVLDREGIIRYRHTGPLTESDMGSTILPLLARLKKP